MKLDGEHGSAERAGAAQGTRIQSVARGCRLLMWLADRQQGATAKEVAFGNRLALATTYHILNTLVDEGLLAKDAQRRYVLGRGTATLAQAYLRGDAVSDELLSGLRELAARTNAAAYLSDWGDRDMRTVASVEGTGLLRVADVAAGPLVDGHARANGKLLLAYADPALRDAYLARHPPRRLTAATCCEAAELERELREIRARGCAYDEQELADGVACVAAPLLRKDRIVAAFGVSVPTERFARTREQLTAAVLEVVDAVARRAPADVYAGRAAALV